MKKINVGVIGAGRIGRIHARNLKFQIPGAKLLAIADVIAESAQTVADELEIPLCEQNYHRLLENGDIQAVVICSSTDTHARIMMEAAEANKHIFCEKPIALEMDKIDRALAAVDKAKVKLQVGFNRRFDPSFRRAKELVESGKIGGLLAFPADFTQKVQAGQATNLEVIVQVEDTSTRMALNGLAQGIASQIGSHTVEIKSVVSLLTQQGASQSDVQKAAAQIIRNDNSSSSTSSLITVQAQNIGDIKPVNASSFVVPGYLVMFVFFAAAMGSIAIIRERQNHTLERLIASSVRK
ncbi:MAG: Gfo/Idh/MocA family oxidoreductase, partial [Deltaproteobacteria bacterium]